MSLSDPTSHTRNRWLPFQASKAPDSHMPALEDDVEGCLGRGEDLIVAGQRLAERGKLGQAYESYCEGIQLLLKVMPRLSEDGKMPACQEGFLINNIITGLGDDPRAGPCVARLRGKISKYLEEAESVKEQRDEQNRPSLKTAGVSIPRTYSSWTEVDPETTEKATVRLPTVRDRLQVLGETAAEAGVAAALSSAPLRRFSGGPDKATLPESRCESVQAVKDFQSL
eukprot:s693_g1.t1